mmetsp:Transcript_4585/g.15264  ORF Transcript_4585/g.15264 Transcript_4585/m.15264 type:complete len:245 (-) Transcript_4585:1298-2032(-)
MTGIEMTRITGNDGAVMNVVLPFVILSWNSDETTKDYAPASPFAFAASGTSSASPSRASTPSSASTSPAPSASFSLSARAARASLSKSPSVSPPSTPRGGDTSSSHGCASACVAVARRSGSKCSMRCRKSAQACASFSGTPYFSWSTLCMGQCFSLLMCRSSPFRVKNSRECFPNVAIFFEIGPMSSIISARWSSSRSYSFPLRGSKRRSPVSNSKTKQAALHTSAGVPYFAPKITSGHRYCLV